VVFKGYTKTGKRIIGTFDLIPATAFIVGRSSDGELIYEGESKVTWDASQTQTQNGEIMFIDEDENYVLGGDVEWRANLCIHMSLAVFIHAELLSTVSGRRDYTDPGEKFENVTLMLFEPYTGKKRRPRFRLFDARTREEITEAAYFLKIRQIHNERNPHALIGEEDLDED